MVPVLKQLLPAFNATEHIMVFEFKSTLTHLMGWVPHFFFSTYPTVQRCRLDSISIENLATAGKKTKSNSNSGIKKAWDLFVVVGDISHVLKCDNWIEESFVNTRIKPKFGRSNSNESTWKNGGRDRKKIYSNSMKIHCTVQQFPSNDDNHKGIRA